LCITIVSVIPSQSELNTHLYLSSPSSNMLAHCFHSAITFVNTVLLTCYSLCHLSIFTPFVSLLSSIHI
jgi:hypothetical protein